LSPARVRLLAVDLDGTLVGSAPDIAHCLDEALQAVGYPPAGEALTRTWIGDGLETLIARALLHAASDEAGEAEADADAALVRKTLAAFLPCYRENLFVRSRLYPAATATLDELRSHGIRLCCITNKRAAFSEELLRLAAVRDRFELVLGGDSLPEKKPSPLPLLTAASKAGVASSDCVLVGDSHQDLRAARSAGFGFVWARYGYGTIEPAEAAPYPAIGSLTELAPLVTARAPV
jgi:phosphoglycolate phosphatase